MLKLIKAYHLKTGYNALFENMNPVFFSDHLPSLKKVFLSAGPQIRQAVLICDRRFQTHPLLKKWRGNKNLKFYYLHSGEKNKSLEKLSLHIKRILSLTQNFDKSSFLFISFGGGSLIDLTGFLASIYKRALPVIHFPTTWLSALDSAHGGKTALNFQGVKNLLGTYHFPKAVFIVKDFLKQNPEPLKKSAFGELLKIAFIEGGGFYKKLKQENAPFFIEPFLKPAIQAKMKIVEQDPFEIQSIRKKLNLGHTVGHILETLYPLPHGLAVSQGLLFSLNWSFHKGFINENNFEEMKNLIPEKKLNKKISPSLFEKHLKQDKKHRKGCRLNFIFIKKPGLVFLESVLEKELLSEARRQGLI